MNTTAKGALFGAFIGFVVMIGIMVLQVQSVVWIHLLWPLRGINRLGSGSGQLWRMVFLTLSFFSNVVLYAVLGGVIGWLISRAGGGADEQRS